MLTETVIVDFQSLMTLSLIATSLIGYMFGMTMGWFAGRYKSVYCEKCGEKHNVLR